MSACPCWNFNVPWFLRKLHLRGAFQLPSSDRMGVDVPVQGHSQQLVHFVQSVWHLLPHVCLRINAKCTFLRSYAKTTFCVATQKLVFAYIRKNVYVCVSTHSYSVCHPPCLGCPPLLIVYVSRQHTSRDPHPPTMVTPSTCRGCQGFLWCPRHRSRVRWDGHCSESSFLRPFQNTTSTASLRIYPKLSV